MSRWAFLTELLCCAGQQRCVTKLPPPSIQDDVALFDRAYDCNDIGAFVNLLDSTQPIDQLDERMHPWAADPRSVGALAATQLAIVASKENDLDMKDHIREAGGIRAIIKLFNSDQIDRQHAAVVALSFLSVDNPRNAIEMFEGGALPHLVSGMKSSIDGMRAATAQTARNIYVLDVRYRREFMKCGGVRNLVELLTLPEGVSSRSEEDLYTQLEAVYHLEDLIIVDGGVELPEYLDAVKKAGSVNKLKSLTTCGNADLQDAAKYLLTRLL